MSTVTSMSRSLRRGVQHDMVQVLANPVLAQAFERVAGASHLNAFHRVLYEPFERARSLDPLLTFGEFIARGSPAQRRMLRELLGPEGYVLATQHSGAEYFASRIAALKGAQPPDGPVPQLFGWGHWGRDPVSIDVTGRTRLLPVDFPVRARSGGGWVYPPWNTGRPRLMQNFGYVELVRRTQGNIDIPLSGGGADLLRALNLPHDPTPRPFPGISAVKMSDLQVAKMYLTGESPAYRAQLLPSQSAAPTGFVLSDAIGGRASLDARYELASRLRDPDLVNIAALRERIGNYPEATSTVVPSWAPNPQHPISGLSNADLLAIARRDVGCLEVAVQTLEVEHRRGQRSMRQMTKLLGDLGQAVDTSLIAHLAGLCDPHNLILLTPDGHAATDFFAYYVQAMGQWVPNSARAGRLTVPSFDAHPDYSRAMNVYTAFSPYHLEPVAYLLRSPEARLVVQRSSSEVIDAYNHLSGCISAAMRSYEMDRSLMPLIYMNGAWR